MGPMGTQDLIGALVCSLYELTKSKPEITQPCSLRPANSNPKRATTPKSPKSFLPAIPKLLTQKNPKLNPESLEPTTGPKPQASDDA